MVRTTQVPTSCIIHELFPSPTTTTTTTVTITTTNPQEQQHDEPPPPGTAADHPPPSAAVTARREAALVHRVMTLLREEDDTVETLLKVLSKAAKDGVDVPRWLGHGRSSNRGRTPLMEACMQGRTACCAALADAACAGGRGLNAKNERGRYSALHYACFHGAEGMFGRGEQYRRIGHVMRWSGLVLIGLLCVVFIRRFGRGVHSFYRFIHVYVVMY